VWRVRSYDAGTAYLEAAEEPEGAPGGPTATPIGLGDDPLTVEILSAA
jgi:hypothetical protein